MTQTPQAQAMDSMTDLHRQLAQIQDHYQQLSRKSMRESELLRRVLGRLAQSLEGSDSELDRLLTDIRIDLDRTKDTSLMIPRLALLERLAFKYSQQRLTHNKRINEAVLHTAECLKATAALPPQLRQDVVMLLDRQQNPEQIDRIERILSLSERAIRLLASLGDQQDARPAPAALQQDTLQKMSDELQHLISELDFDSDAGERLLEIRNQLLIGTSVQQLVHYSFEIIELILQGTRTERRLSRRFLAALNDDLSALHQSMNKSMESTYSDHKGMQGLNREMQDTLQLLERAPNLSGEQVQFALQQLRSITERHHRLCQQMYSSIERSQSNEGRLCAIIEQTTDYRNRLLDQQHRLFLDHLTKVYNRAALQERLDLEYKRWQRYQQPLWFVMVDIDRFKDLNDTYGHLAGDKALKIIARAIQQSLRETDFIARFGGEEFALLISDMSPDELSIKLDEIREKISQLPFKFHADKVSITVSLGASELQSGDTISTWQERADKALYHAKNNGRNQIFIH
ncbi:sensor domain-containing diguanylate cyclase [Plesiomonas shigelloides]|uniref:GGDEF domain-containing protein n=1 Tax=Plesiomonas shigelloides TaxID=703 RepID=UPI001262439B|nr:GGDEF domain-containing protein [Plesiomonas shigelloides]KAB7662369.1 diguanylate cyclase [Plesiomonas shigelloides]